MIWKVFKELRSLLMDLPTERLYILLASLTTFGCLGLLAFALVLLAPRP